MNGLIGCAVLCVATSCAMNKIDFDSLSAKVEVAKAYKEDVCIKTQGLNPLIIAICKGDHGQVARFASEQPVLMFQKIHGLLPVHWAVIAKQGDIREWLEKQNHKNLWLLSDFGLNTFNLNIQFDAWYQDQEKKRQEWAGYK